MEKGDYYYSLSGGTLPCSTAPGLVRADFLFRSRDKINWEYLHPFVENDRFTLIDDDGSCPYFLPIGDKHILLFFSHQSGGQYLLGDYDEERDKFMATGHGKFNHYSSMHSGVHAPSAYSDGKGGVIAIYNMNEGMGGVNTWNRIMTLPMLLTLGNDGVLNMKPAIEAEKLRYGHQHLDEFEVPGNQEIVLDNISGNATEIEVDALGCSSFELNVLRSPDKKEFTKISFYKNRGYRNFHVKNRSSMVTLDNTYSSLRPVRSRIPEVAPVTLMEGENLKLNIFIDKSLVEVYVNGRQYLAERVYPTLGESLGVSVKAVGSKAVVKSIDAWQMKNIYE